MRRATDFYDGSKLCTSGCLGYGDCIKVCSQGAISIVDGIAVIDKAKCMGCGLCAKACPNGLIAVRRISQAVDICCSSRDVGRVTRSVCPNGCIGCKLCEKNCPSGAVTVQNNHAVIDYDKCTNCGKCAEVCRVHAIRSIMGEKSGSAVKYFAFKGRSLDVYASGELFCAKNTQPNFVAVFTKSLAFVDIYL